MMKPQSSRAVPLKLMLALTAVLLTPLAQAHPGHDPAAGFTHGFFHPLTGIDHVLAMIAVGLWAAQRGGRAMWAMPLAFVTLMAVGGIAGSTGIAVPFIEQGIALSVLMLGMLVAVAARWRMAPGVLVVGLFALFHGYAHGTEMPGVVSGFEYGAGFMLATALLHSSGVAVALLARSLDRGILVRLSGGFIAASGACLLLA